jgi:Zn-dependent membrane protease YugP
MKIVKYLQIAEVSIGMGLIAMAVLFHLNTLFCFVNKESCGMIEPLISYWAILLGSTLLVSGMCLSYPDKKRWMGHLLFALTIVFVLTID